MTKRCKKPREPKQPEPYLSPITGAERGELVERLEGNTASDDDAIMALGELNRATTKRDVAKHQQDSIAATPFIDPREREASATATAETMYWPVKKIVQDGAKHGRDFVARRESARTVAKKRREQTEDKIADEYRRIKAEGCKPRARAKTIALTLGRTPQYVGRVINRLKLS